MKLKKLIILIAAIALIGISCVLFIRSQVSRDNASEGEALPEEALSGSEIDVFPEEDVSLEENIIEDSPLEENTVSEPEPVLTDAEQVAFYVLVEDIYTTAPTDDDYYSIQNFEAEASMRLYPDRPVGSLYLVWNELPGSFQIAVNGKVQDYDGSAFLHQYVSLPEASTDIVLITPDHPTHLCDVYAFTPGIPPDWVQQWRTLGEGEYSDLMLFPTHADDEFLFFGGIIPYYAGELGLNVQVVYMNRHTGYDWVRNHELLNGLWTAGDSIYPVINEQEDYLFDSLEETALFYGYNVFTAFQIEQIRRYRPSVVIGHDFDGEYGHNTHRLNAICLKDAVELASDSTVCPESAELYGVWDVPKFYVHLWPQNPIVLDYETPLESFEGKTALEIAEEAYGCHFSQHGSYAGVYWRGSYDSHRFGLYRTTVGNDTGNDLMENLSAYTP